MTLQQFTQLAEKLMAMDNKYDVTKVLIDLYHDAKIEGMQVVKEIQRAK